MEVPIWDLLKQTSSSSWSEFEPAQTIRSTKANGKQTKHMDRACMDPQTRLPSMMYYDVQYLHYKASQRPISSTCFGKCFFHETGSLVHHGLLPSWHTKVPTCGWLSLWGTMEGGQTATWRILLWVAQAPWELHEKPPMYSQRQWHVYVIAGYSWRMS